MGGSLCVKLTNIIIIIYVMKKEIYANEQPMAKMFCRLDKKSQQTNPPSGLNIYKHTIEDPRQLCKFVASPQIQFCLNEDGYLETDSFMTKLRTKGHSCSI